MFANHPHKSECLEMFNSHSLLDTSTVGAKADRPNRSLDRHMAANNKLVSMKDSFSGRSPEMHRQQIALPEI